MPISGAPDFWNLPYTSSHPLKDALALEHPPPANPGAAEVYLSAMMADWLQGPFVYALYASYGRSPMKLRSARGIQVLYMTE